MTKFFVTAEQFEQVQTVLRHTAADLNAPNAEQNGLGMRAFRDMADRFTEIFEYDLTTTMIRHEDLTLHLLDDATATRARLVTYSDGGEATVIWEQKEHKNHEISAKAGDQITVYVTGEGSVKISVEQDE